MELKEAIEVLKNHNVWRRFDGEIDGGPEMISPKIIGIAIDTVVSEYENLCIKKPLPKDRKGKTNHKNYEKPL